jgi:hypothetical protein
MINNTFMQPGQRLSASVVNFKFIAQNMRKFAEIQRYFPLLPEITRPVLFVQRSNKSRPTGGFIILS